MRKFSSKRDFLSLFTFLAGMALLLTNGFTGRIFAAEEEDPFEQLSPIADAIAHVLQDYVYEPEMDAIVEGALVGIMNSLDRNSGYLPAEGFQMMQEDTEGEFDGIGVTIKFDEDNRIMIFQPLPEAPAAKAGLRSGDLILEIDGVSTEGIDLGEAARRIKGPSGREVHLKVLRGVDSENPQTLEFDVKRGKIPMESILESRLLDNGVAYVRISDFKKHTAEELEEDLEAFMDEGMKGLVLDLRWNPGGLLSASRDVSQLFLPKNTLVTQTRGRLQPDGQYADNMKLYTERAPILPPTVPIVILTNEFTASSSEIVTGALQYHQRAIIVGEKSYGKGSVQTIIPLRKPERSALRLTTALYYTPGDVTIDRVGIQPDVPVEMDEETEAKLLEQMYKSFADDPNLRHEQNHGTVTGAALSEELIEDVILQRAVQILTEGLTFDQLVKKYHKDVKDTQVAAADSREAAFRATEEASAEVLP